MKKPICLVGDVIVDVTLKSEDTPLKMRLGGIVHAARALWALEIPYAIAYFAPEYLDTHIRKYLSELNCLDCYKLGNTYNCPNVMLIGEVKEVGDQGYEFLLRDDIEITYYENEFENLRKYEDIFFISGNYDFSKISESLFHKCNIFIDAANNVEDLTYFDSVKTPIDTIFISTSSTIFKKHYEKGTFKIDNFFSIFKDVSEKVVLKENRGGSRAYDFRTSELVHICAQTTQVVHSVGVGDVYDATYISLKDKVGFSGSLNYASWIATEYGKTTYPQDFKTMVQRVMKLNVDDVVSLGGCFLPWEIREKGHVYIAAPDFDFVNIQPIDHLCACLEYHNFTPHRPIKENGQMEKNASPARKHEIFSADMVLMDKCNSMIAVLLYDDPGTLIEIGIAAERNMPVFVYDPYNRASNCMLTQLPELVSSDLDEIISALFSSYSKILK